MKYTVFGKEINIDDALVKEYESYVEKINSDVLEYLAVTSEIDENSANKELVKGIIEGMEDEINVHKNVPNIMKELSAKFV